LLDGCYRGEKHFRLCPLNQGQVWAVDTLASTLSRLQNYCLLLGRTRVSIDKCGYAGYC
jgi:hypothetical protein